MAPAAAIVQMGETKMTPFNALGLHLGNLSRLSDAKTHSISPKNFTGEPGRGGTATEGTGQSAARSLGQLPDRDYL
jgi:hypothetical protein